jgi:catechol 2,3-dioxygenase-like lactoylglutathione lyase family enzyme
MRPTLTFDHIAVAATSLAEGVDFVAARLGVRVPAGGRHPVMHTHNAVMRIGDGLYLEVIAIDPEAGPPERPRWFGLDDPAVQAMLATRGPQLVAWLVRSTDIAATLALAETDLGTTLPMSRGDLHWRIAVRDDGRPPLGGLHPIVIEWPEGPHVSERMADAGVRLERLTLRSGTPAVLTSALAAIGADGLAEVRPARRGAAPLEAVLRTPDGRMVALTGEIASGGVGICGA